MRFLRYGLWAIALFISVNLAVAASLVWPGWAFSHSGGTDRLRIHASQPVPDAAIAWAEAVMASLDVGPLPPGADPVDLYITGDGWRYRWFFMGAPGAGGVIYAGSPGRRVFLAGAAFETDRLILPDRIVPPPRTLSYYARHEITHLTQIETLGRFGFYRMDPVMREGIADLIALGPASAALQAVLAARDPAAGDADLRDAFGAYPMARTAVTRALENATLQMLMERQR